MGIVTWPPPTPPNTRVNATGQLDNHPSDHNRIADALDTIIARLGAGTNAQLGYAEQVAGQSNIATTAVDLTNLSITFTLATQRRVRIEANIWYTKAAPDTTANAFAQLATAANAEIQQRCSYLVAPGYVTIPLVVVKVLPAGTYTYKARAWTGAGFLNTQAAATQPNVIMATDLGPG